MIRIDDDYVILVDDNNYTPCVDLHKVQIDKNGSEINRYIYIGYCSTLEKALELLVEYKVRKSLSDNEVSLLQAISILREEHKKFKEYVENIKE